MRATLSEALLHCHTQKADICWIKIQNKQSSAQSGFQSGLDTEPLAAVSAGYCVS